MVCAPLSLNPRGDENPVDDPGAFVVTVFLVPLGLVVGPVMGFCKGLALDYSWITGRASYGEIYSTYGRASIWRPYHWQWIEPPKKH